MQNTGSDIVIRRLQLESPELPLLARWRYDLFLKGMGLTLADSERQLRDIAVSPLPYEVALFADVAGTPAGICMLVENEIEPLHRHSPWLASLIVDEPFRGRGLARILVKAIEVHAARHGIRDIHLYTDSAEGLYARCGWTVTDRFEDHGIPCVLMRREIDASP